VLFLFGFRPEVWYTWRKRSPASQGSAMNWDILIKQARDCHTKQAWEQFFDETGEILATSSHAKPIEDIFKILRQDPQSLLYDPRIWGRLIQGCLSSWSLELGHEITEFTRK
jgi:hypothetical protein